MNTFCGTFIDRLDRIQRAKHSAVCVGLDPDPERLPQHLLRRHAPADAILHFHREIIAATAPYACAYKLNLAFFEVLGEHAYRVLSDTLAVMPENVLTIADGKRADIGNSARFYAASSFDIHGFDACTVAPYMGGDSVAPFLAYAGKAAFILAKTSNPGSKDFQELMAGDASLSTIVAKHVAKWDASSEGTAGLVVGATHPAELFALRSICPNQPFLIPGIGAQGGRWEGIQSLRGPKLVSSSRQILYASSGDDFAAAAAEETCRLRDRISAISA